MNGTKWYEDRNSLDGCLVLVVMADGTEVRGRMDEIGRIPLGKDVFWPSLTPTTRNGTRTGVSRMSISSDLGGSPSVKATPEIRCL